MRASFYDAIIDWVGNQIVKLWGRKITVSGYPHKIHLNTVNINRDNSNTIVGGYPEKLA